jgi:hypothetical protein
MERTTEPAEPRVATRGFFPVVAGGDVRVQNGGGLVFLARRSLSVQQGGGQWFVSAGNLDVRQGGGAAFVARTAHVESGFFGAIVAWKAEVAPGARVLLQGTAAVAVAAAAGFLAGWLAGARRRSAADGTTVKPG